MPPTDTVRRLRAGQPITEGWAGDVVDALARQHTGANVYIDGIGVLHRPDPRTAGHPKIRLIQIQPDTGKRYGTANAAGVLDAKVVSLDPAQGGDLREADWDEGEECWVLPLRHTPESLTIVTYSSTTGTFTAGEVVTQQGSGATGNLFQDTGTTLEIHTGHGSAAFTVGDATNATITGADSAAEAEMDVGSGASVYVDPSSIAEEKVNLLPAWDVYKARYVGILDVSGDERPLYVIDEEPKLRQFEIADDNFVQNADESWPNKMAARFIDEPGQPRFTLYLPGEFEIESLSAYFPGIGRLGVPGHKGSFGFARWNEVRKRWEIAEGLFKTFALGTTNEQINAGTRGTVAVSWKVLGETFTGVEGAGFNVEAFNWNTERIDPNSKVGMIFDRQENLWYIVYVDRPVLIAGTLTGYLEPIGKIQFATDEAQTDYIYSYPFKLTEQATGHVLVEQLGPPELRVAESDGNPSIGPCRVLLFHAGFFTVANTADKEATVSLADGLSLGGDTSFGGHVSLPANNRELQLGPTAGGDFQIYFDGTGAVINVDTGDLAIVGSSVTLDNDEQLTLLQADTTPVEAVRMSASDQLRFYGGAVRIVSSGNLLIGKDADTIAKEGFILNRLGVLNISKNGTTAQEQIRFGRGTAGSLAEMASIATTGTELILKTANTDAVVIDASQNFHFPADSQEIQLGATAGGDAQISHDGANAVLNVDTGNFVITGANVAIGTTSAAGQFTLKNSGNDTAPLGSELVTNGDFPSDLSSP